MSIRRRLELLLAPTILVTATFFSMGGVSRADSTVNVTPTPIPVFEDTSPACVASGGLFGFNSYCGAGTAGGEVITVSVAANMILLPNAVTTIMECQASVLTPPGANLNSCDPVTATNTDYFARPIMTSGAGALTVQIPVNTLPTTAPGGFDPNSTIVVDQDHPLVLWIGSDFTGHFGTHSILSPAIPLSSDEATTQLPEVQYAAALPLVAVGLLGSAAAIARRRSRSRTHHSA